MSGEIAKMWATLELRDQQYHVGMARAKNEALAFVGQITGTFGQLRGSLNTMLASTVVRGTVGLFGSMIMSAADLNESINKVDKTFGPAADSVKKKVNELADSFGLVKSSTLDAAAGIGLMLRASGLQGDPLARLTNQLVQTAADASSLYNVSMEESLQKIRSGLAGEAEPLRTMGVMLTEDAVKAEALGMGFQKVGKDFDQGAKVSARASLIMKGLGVASGDLADTFDSAKNQARGLSGQIENMKAEIGQGLLGAYEAVTPAIADALKEMMSFARDHQEDIKALADAIGTDLVGALKSVSEYVHYGIEDIKALGAAWEAAPDWVKGLAGGGAGGERTEFGKQGMFSWLATEDMREKAAFEASKKAGSSDLAAHIDAFTAGTGLPSLPGGVKPERVLAPDELSENQKRHLREEAERQRVARINRPEIFNPPPVGPAPPPSPFLEKQREVEQRRRDTQAFVDQITALPKFGLGAPVSGLMRPEGMMTPEEREKALKLDRIPFGEMTPEEQLDALKKQRGTIESLMPKEPTRSSQLFTEGGSMEQQFQQKILEQGDKQGEANKLLKSIDDRIKALNEATLKKEKEKAYAMIAPAGAARR